MSNRNEVTIHDVAKALGLSTSTVSRALSGTGFVNEETRSKITRVASELGYRRNYFASGLRSQKSHLLGAAVTRLNTTVTSAILAGAEETASRLGYGVIVSQSMNKPELRVTNIKNLRHYGIDGLLVTAAFFQESASSDHLATLDIPVVVVEESSLLPNRPKKQITDFQNAYELTSHLIEKGCQKIALVSADLNKPRQTNLISGYHEALQHNKLAAASTFVLNNSDVQTSWLDVCEVMISMSSRPDGIIFSNNAITALAFTPSANSEEIWLTCRKGSLSSRNQLLMELGGLAVALLVSLCTGKTALSSESKQTSKR